MPGLQPPVRAVHLDFHTGPWVPQVAKDFDPEEFAQTLARAHVESANVFAKCHHGHLYYETDRPERHPSLPSGLDLLRLQIEALHRVGIRAPIYLSVQCDEYAANAHPEWVVRGPDLRQVKRAEGVFEAGWQILDMSSPYQEYFVEQLQEVLDRFAPVDGLLLDMCWDQPSASPWAVEGMVTRGLDPRREQDREQYARETAYAYMRRFRDMAQAAQKGPGSVRIWFNGRPKMDLALEKELVSEVVVEALPTGGWGYDYLPYVARFVRRLGLPASSHTGRFFTGWGDNASLKPEMALKYECCQMLSLGLSCCIGDVLHPRGRLDAAVYDLVGSVYAHISACEPYLADAQPCSQIALVVSPELGDAPGPSVRGAVRMLRQLQQQFDVVPKEGDLHGYELVIVPEVTEVDPALAQRLRAHLQGGGALVICGAAALDENSDPVLEELGVVVHGASPYSHTFLHPSESVAHGLADFGHVMYKRGFRMTPAAGSESLVAVGEPYFERSYDRFCGHAYTPEGSPSPYSAVVRKGRAMAFSVPIFEAYGKHASPNHRTLFGNCLNLLLPEPLVRAEAPSVLEAAVVEGSHARIVHLLSFCPERRGEGLDVVEEPFPIVDMPISIKSATRPSRVFLAPNEMELSYDHRGGYVHTRVTMLEGHALLVLER